MHHLTGVSGSTLTAVHCSFLHFVSAATEENIVCRQNLAEVPVLRRKSSRAGSGRIFKFVNFGCTFVDSDAGPCADVRISVRFLDF